MPKICYKYVKNSLDDDWKLACCNPWKPAAFTLDFLSVQEESEKKQHSRVPQGV